MRNKVKPIQTQNYDVYAESQIENELFNPDDEDSSDDEQDIPFLKPGQCQKGICGKEAACLPYPNNTYTCICPHDKSPPTKDWRCVRITVPPTPHPIKNIRLTSEGNNTTTPKDAVLTNIGNYTNNATTGLPPATEAVAEKSLNYPNVLLVAVVSGMTLILLIVALFTILSWLRRKHGHSCFHTKECSTSPSPIVLKRNLLVPERYAPNPQYSACSSSSVPILQRETLKFLNEIGEGCFGKVFKGELHLDNSDQSNIVAVKVLKESASREVEEDFFREVDIMSAFRHKNILSLMGVVLRDAGSSPMMVFEYMPHGDLAELLRAQRKLPNPDNPLPQLSSNDLMLIARQISSGMSYLAAQRFVHRDLACRNCLVTSGPIVKIADFGMSRDVYTCDYYKIGGSRLLPVRWMSPESVLYGRFTLESDIWSYGIILWEIYSFGKQPYYGHSNEEVVKLILQGIMLIPPEDCPTLICDLMKCCWKTEPRDRIKFSEIYDRLEKVFTDPCAEGCTKESLESDFKPNFSTLRKLPRPPAILPLGPELDLLDTEGYLLPNTIKEPVKYLDVQGITYY